VSTYDEAGYVVGGDVPTNDAGLGLEIESIDDDTAMFAGMEAITSRDVKGTTLRGDNVKSATPPKDEVDEEDV
jgi:hypothetical protein